MRWFKKRRMPRPSQMLTYNKEHAVYETDFADTIPTDHAPLEGEKRTRSKAWFKVSFAIALALIVAASASVILAFHLARG